MNDTSSIISSAVFAIVEAERNTAPGEHIDEKMRRIVDQIADGILDGLKHMPRASKWNVMASISKRFDIEAEAMVADYADEGRYE